MEHAINNFERLRIAVDYVNIGSANDESYDKCASIIKGIFKLVDYEHDTIKMLEIAARVNKQIDEINSQLLLAPTVNALTCWATVNAAPAPAAPLADVMAVDVDMSSSVDIHDEINASVKAEVADMPVADMPVADMPVADMPAAVDDVINVPVAETAAVQSQRTRKTNGLRKSTAIDVAANELGERFNIRPLLDEYMNEFGIQKKHLFRLNAIIGYSIRRYVEIQHPDVKIYRIIGNRMAGMFYPNNLHDEIRTHLRHVILPKYFNNMPQK